MVKVRSARAYCPQQREGIYTINRYLGRSYYNVTCNICGKSSDAFVTSIRNNVSCKFCPTRGKIKRNKYNSGDTVGCHKIIEYIGAGKYWTECINCKAKGKISSSNIHTSRKCSACPSHSAVLVENVISTDHYLYTVWGNILARCQNANSPNYKRYGGRGIDLCSTWVLGSDGKTGFQCFVDDVHNEIKLRPNMRDNHFNSRTPGSSEYHLGRKNHDDWYKPGNIQWELATDNISEASSRRANREADLVTENAELRARLESLASLSNVCDIFESFYQLREQSLSLVA